MSSQETYLGLVRRVVGAKVLVEISPDVPSASPIVHGYLHRLGQVGSFVRIPVGYLSLYGVVSMVGASDTVAPSEMDLPVPLGQRWIEVQLVGESYGHEEFQRGVSVFPTIDDEVHIVTEDDLSVIYRRRGESQVAVGHHSASESLVASVDLDKLVTRHAAILGSTGSGKSNTVARILKAIASEEYPSAQVVVVDPHGEYAPAFDNVSRVLSIGGSGHPLRVPYWALAFDELTWFLVDRRTPSESPQDAALRDYVFKAKQDIARDLAAGPADPGEITVDSPIPFDLRRLWYHFDRLERLTYENMERTVEALIQEGDPATLTPAQFRPPGAGSSAPFKPLAGAQLPMGPYVNRILGRLRDSRFDFLLSPAYDGIARDLHDLLAEWVGHEHAITIFDLAGVPFEVTDVVVGVLTRMLFEAMFWGRDLPGIGRARPLLIVFEEAHSYLPRSEGRFIAGYARRSVQRILKEGRKYGVGAIVVSQRPSELDETILSQCGTFFALRLSNSSDQGIVRSAVPDALAGLIDLIPALRTGEALVLGEAIQIPSRVRVPLVEPRPMSDDPAVARQWRTPRPAAAPYAQAVSAWRNQRVPTASGARPKKEDGQDGHGTSVVQ